MPLRYRRVTYRYAPPGLTQSERLCQREWNCGLLLSFAPSSQWRPATDVYETATDLVVRVELAGMREEDIEVTLYEDVLVVAGRREPERAAGALRFHEASIRRGRFQAEIALPVAVDRERVAAQYDCGFLQVKLPKQLPTRRNGGARR